MRTLFVVLLCWAAIGCTKHNPASCCTTAEQCSSFGFGEIYPCSSDQTCDATGTCVPLMAPSDLTYSENPATYTAGSAIAPNNPSSLGGAVATYGVSPSLPDGLSLDVTTGTITGTPTGPAPTASYVITASNDAGATTAALSIIVNDVAPADLVYSANPIVYTQGIAITPNKPSSAGGAATSYSVSPALPTGLSLDTTTGIITGVPFTRTLMATYTVTVTNKSGSATAALSLAVDTTGLLGVGDAFTCALQAGGVKRARMRKSIEVDSIG